MPAHDGSIELTWAGDLRTFRLTIDQLLALQEASDCGPGELYNKLRFGSWRIEHLQAIFRLGLIGAEIDGREAKKIVDRSIVAGDILRHIDPALEILGAALQSPEPVGKQTGGTETDASPLPPSMETAPFSTTPPNKSDG
jgi:hypothetical protein